MAAETPKMPRPAGEGAAASAGDAARIAAQVAQLVELVKKREKIDAARYEFKTISWLDHFNGRRPKIDEVVGRELPEQLTEMIERAAREIYGEGVKVPYAVLGSRPAGFTIYIQLHEDQYNEYGSYVGTEKWWTTIDNILKAVSNHVERLEKINSIVKRIMKEIGEVR